MVEAVKEPLEWQSWQAVVREFPAAALPQTRRMRGVVGIGEGLHIRFLYPRNQTPLDALYAVEEHEAEVGAGLPPSVAGAALAAAQAKRLPTVAPMIVAKACGLQPHGGRTRFNRRQIEGLVDKYLRTMIGDTGLDVFIPGGSTDRARFWLAAARRLWNPKTRREVARAGVTSLEAILMARSLASVWLELQAIDRVRVAGVHLRVPQEALVEAWPQVLEWERLGISAEALHYLVGGEMPGGKLTVNRFYPPEVPRSTLAEREIPTCAVGWRQLWSARPKRRPSMCLTAVSF